VSALDQVRAWPVDQAAVAVVDPSGVVASTGAVDEPLDWASVTKLSTAMATWIAVEEGTLHLDGPAGPPGSTVRHLLAHASGLAFEGDEVWARPGTRRIYSNRGYDLLGDLLAAAAGMPFERYLREAVHEPLGLAATSLQGAPSAGMVGTLEDLTVFTAELLRPTLVSMPTAMLARTVAFPGIDGVLPGFGRQDPNDWGLGPELRGGKSPHWTPTTASPRTFGHFGRAGGFVWVDPDAELACCCLTNRPFGPWATEAWPRLGDAALAEWGKPHP
jgi:CubicO group peptidase (beta-lactamase class C family)